MYNTSSNTIKEYDLVYVMVRYDHGTEENLQESSSGTEENSQESSSGHFTAYIPVDETTPLQSEWLFLNDDKIKIRKNVHEVLEIDTVRNFSYCYAYKLREYDIRIIPCSHDYISAVECIDAFLGNDNKISKDLTSYESPEVKSPEVKVIRKRKRKKYS